MVLFLLSADDATVLMCSARQKQYYPLVDLKRGVSTTCSDGSCSSCYLQKMVVVLITRSVSQERDNFGNFKENMILINFPLLVNNPCKRQAFLSEYHCTIIVLYLCLFATLDQETAETP